MGRKRTIPDAECGGVILLFHADRPPEFHELKNLSAPPCFIDLSAENNTITYESLGKIYTDAEIPAETFDGRPARTMAFIRAFAHPDLIAQIKRDGTLMVTPLEPYELDEEEE